MVKKIYLGFNEGELVCKFNSKEDAKNDPFGATDYVAELDEDDVKTLREWLSKVKVK
jgi:hypothetical protein